MRKIEVTATEKGLIFIDPKDGKIIDQPEFETRETPESAVKGLLSEIKERGKRTRDALNLLIEVFQQRRMDGYQGKTEINARLGTDVKQAMRETEDIYLKEILYKALPEKMPDLKKQEEWDMFIKRLREPGIYARARGVALKYYACLGRLPCMYDDSGKPDTSKLLPVSAMERLLTMATGTKPTIDRTIPAEIGRLIARVREEKDDLSVETLGLVITRCEELIGEAKGLIGLKNAEATRALHGLVQVAGVITGAPAQLTAPDNKRADVEAKPAESTAKAEPVAKKAASVTKGKREPAHA